MLRGNTAPSQSLRVVGLNAAPLEGGRPGYAVAFGDDADPTRASLVASRTDKSTAWLVYPVVRHEKVETIRGQLGYLETYGASGGSSLTWWEHDDLQVVVFAQTPEAARALAESLVEVSDAEWAAFLSAATPAEVLTMPTTTTVP